MTDDSKTVLALEGERLIIERRRAGLTQAEAAGLYGLHPNGYRKREKSTKGSRSRMRLTPAEWCFLMRRRAGWTLEDTANASGLTIKWIHYAEQGERDIEPLVTFWNEQIDVDLQALVN